MNRDLQIPDEIDERLREWGRYFKDRHRFNRCLSIEGRFNHSSPGSWDEGWGDQVAPQAPPPEIKLPRVLKTHEALQWLPKGQKWAITYAYCYPNLEKWRVLKMLKKWTGERFTWNKYLDTLEIGRIRIWAKLV